MKVAIFGVGAMATYYAYAFKPHGQVILLGHWQEQINALRLKGFNAYHIEQSIPFKADLILFLTKSYRTKFYLPHIKYFLKENGHVLTLQNGLGNREMISEEVGQCLYGVTFQAVKMESLGQIEEINRGDIIFSHHPHIFRVARFFKEAGFKIKIVQNIEGLAWSKLIINASINPVTALFEVQNGELLKNEVLKSMALHLAIEAFTVAKAASIDNLFFRNTQELKSYLFYIIDHTAKNNSSMLQDKKRQNITEIDFINGAIIKRADVLGVSAHLNRLITEYVKMPYCPFFLKQKIPPLEEFTPSPNN